MNKGRELSTDEFIGLFDSEKFNIPLQQEGNLSFPDFLAKKLKEFESYIAKEFAKLNSVNGQDTQWSFGGLKFLNRALNKTVSLYYEGKVLEATKVFNSSIQKYVVFELKNSWMSISEEQLFYRARSHKEGVHFEKKDLFHIKFEERHSVSTNRYSIPGFPALYLGDSSYVCWEEFNRPKMQELWFSLFKPTKDLKVIKLLRFNDLIEDIKGKDDTWKMIIFLMYIRIFPLLIACTIKVKHPKGNFKPEYIIPQLLLQFVSKSGDFDGIKYPSTKVIYNKLTKVNAYNYVFPVKSNFNIGFCKVLERIFCMTEPTSLEMEQILDSPQNSLSGWIGVEPDFSSTIEILKGENTPYVKTSFGAIEDILKDRKISVLSE